jgi:hypothetical protein
MLLRRLLILVFKLFRYLFSMRLCEFWRFRQGDKSFSDRFCFRARFVVVLVSRSGCSASQADELDGELLDDEAKLGNFLMVGKSSSKGLLHGADGVLAFSKAVGIIQGSMTGF